MQSKSVYDGITRGSYLLGSYLNEMNTRLNEYFTHANDKATGTKGVPGKQS